MITDKLEILKGKPMIEDPSIDSSLPDNSRKTKIKKSALPDTISENGAITVESLTSGDISELKTADDNSSAGIERIRKQIQEQEIKLAQAEKLKAETKSSLKKWVDDYKELNGRDPTEEDRNTGARHLFSAHSKVSYLLTPSAHDHRL